MGEGLGGVVRPLGRMSVLVDGWREDQGEDQREEEEEEEEEGVVAGEGGEKLRPGGGPRGRRGVGRD